VELRPAPAAGVPENLVGDGLQKQPECQLNFPFSGSIRPLPGAGESHAHQKGFRGGGVKNPALPPLPQGWGSIFAEYGRRGICYQTILFLIFYLLAAKVTHAALYPLYGYIISSSKNI